MKINLIHVACVVSFGWLLLGCADDVNSEDPEQSTDDISLPGSDSNPVTSVDCSVFGSSIHPDSPAPYSVSFVLA